MTRLNACATSVPRGLTAAMALPRPNFDLKVELVRHHLSMPCIDKHLEMFMYHGMRMSDMYVVLCSQTDLQAHCGISGFIPAPNFAVSAQDQADDDQVSFLCICTYILHVLPHVCRMIVSLPIHKKGNVTLCYPGPATTRKYDAGQMDLRTT